MAYEVSGISSTIGGGSSSTSNLRSFPRFALAKTVVQVSVTFGAGATGDVLVEVLMVVDGSEDTTAVANNFTISALAGQTVRTSKVFDLMGDGYKIKITNQDPSVAITNVSVKAADIIRSLF